MSDAPADVYLAYIDAENRRDRDAMDAVLAPELTVTFNGRPVLGSSEADAEATAELWAAYPDYRRTVDGVVASGDEVVASWRMIGRPRPDLAGRLGELAISGCSWVTVVGGRIVDARLYGDDLPVADIHRALTEDSTDAIEA